MEVETTQIFRNSIRKKNQPMTMEQIQRIAPAVFATKPIETASKRYTFYPTIEILEHLEKEGWQVFDAQQAHKDDGNQLLGKHYLKLRHQHLTLPVKVGDTVPELVLTNSHDLSTAFSMRLGLFRLACTNGMMVSMRTLGDMTINHSYSMDNVRRGIEIISQKAPAIGNRIQEMQVIDLDDYERREFAIGALALKTKGEVNPDLDPGLFLHARREQDQNHDLWSTYNVVQENIMMGGVSYERRNTTGLRHVSLRGVSNIMDDLRINDGLWDLAENTAWTHQRGVLAH